jgi:hypothetical protein
VTLVSRTNSHTSFPSSFQGREVCVILHDIEVVGSLLAWRARDSNTLWHLTAVIVLGQGVVVGVYEQVVWPQCVKTRCQGRRVGDTGCLQCRPAEGR